MKKFLNYILMITILLTTTFVFANILERDKNVSLIMKYSAMYGIDSAIPMAIGKIESDYTSNAYNKNVKSKHHKSKLDRESRGVMQLTFSTAKYFNPEIKTLDDLYNPEMNVKASILYLKYLLKRYKHYPVEEIAALYNSGETQYFNHNGNISKEYRIKFMKFYNMFKPKPVIKKKVHHKKKMVWISGVVRNQKVNGHKVKKLVKNIVSKVTISYPNAISCLISGKTITKDSSKLEFNIVNPFRNNK
jgi:hypothetical protein